MPAAVRPTFTLPFWIASTASFLCLAGGSTFVLLPLYLERNGLHRWEIGLVAGSFSLVSVFARPWVGEQVDRRGRRLFFMSGATLLGLLALAFMAAPPTLPCMIGLRGLQGLGMALFFTAMWTWVADYAPEGRMGEVLGIFGISGLLAGAAGPVLGEFALHRGGFGAVFAVGGGLMLAAALLSRHLQDRMPERDPRAARPSGFWSLSISPAMAGTTLGSLAFGISSGTLLTFAAPFVASRGQTGVGLFFTIYTAASVGVRLFSGRLSDRLAQGWIIAPALVCQALGLALFSRLQESGWLGLPLLGAAALAGGTGHGLIYPALSSLAVTRAGAARRGVGISLFTAAVEVGVFAGATLAGVLADLAGYADTFLVVAAAVTLAAALPPLLESRFEGAREDFPDPLP